MKIAECKMDCNFGQLLANNYTNDTGAFVGKIITKLRPDVGSSCGMILDRFLPPKPPTADNILSSLSIKKILKQ
jgi:hypothetical protein